VIVISMVMRHFGIMQGAVRSVQRISVANLIILRLAFRLIVPCRVSFTQKHEQK
jgi:hypothetical protein